MWIAAILCSAAQSKRSCRTVLMTPLLTSVGPRMIRIVARICPRIYSPNKTPNANRIFFRLTSCPIEMQKYIIRRLDAIATRKIRSHSIKNNTPLKCTCAKSSFVRYPPAFYTSAPTSPSVATFAAIKMASSVPHSNSIETISFDQICCVDVTGREWLRYPSLEYSP